MLIFQLTKDEGVNITAAQVTITRHAGNLGLQCGEQISVSLGPAERTATV